MTESPEAEEASSNRPEHHLPNWIYHGPLPSAKESDPMRLPDLDGPNSIDLGGYSRKNVSNVDMDPKGRAYFDIGLRLMLSYQHEMASKFFLACLHFSPHCALAHGLVALSHSPNYNFKGEAYYVSANHPEDESQHDLLCVFPSQQVAARHSKMAMEKIEELKRLRKKQSSNKKGGKRHKKSKKGPAAASQNGDHAHGESESALPEPISDVEVQLLSSIRILTCNPGLNHELADDIAGRPYADSMRKVFQKYPNDPEVAYCFAEALMVLNAWNLFEYPTGRPVSPDVEECRQTLETALKQHSSHAGLCHMYVHLSEMSATPQQALEACKPLRSMFPHAGHLIHMPTHIDVLVGNYVDCVKYNHLAIVADERAMQVSPGTAGQESFYFGYIVHNFHMAVYGSILGGFEAKGMELANHLNSMMNEETFEGIPDLTAYLESYAALDIHVMVRFGRWAELLEMTPPKNQRLMLFRACSLRFAQCLAQANLGNIDEAKRLLKTFDSLRGDPEAEHRILHNNSVADLLAVDAVMARGEIAYFEKKYDEAFALLRKAVKMQDNLNYDEPWGKMQPIRHALGGLLLEQGHLAEAEQVFRRDLRYHPRNPWALVGLISTLRAKSGSGCCDSTPGDDDEVAKLEDQLEAQRKVEFADFEVRVACACCSSIEM